ncbi:ankyrin repeat and SOCS box protein 3 [Procambarus clarkii]|uniref:ankyrin repeat and SOCS box protein 3 n=1 Tax=Procambarus clarkii TaxID=6728 RepID=UPI003741FC95
MGGKTVLLVVAALTVLSLRVQADINADGAAAMTAIRNNNASLALQLINNNPALAFWSDADNQTLLILASAMGMSSVVQRLVDLGANLEATTNQQPGATPLILATRSCCTECISALVKAGSNVNAQNSLGWSPLILAAWYCESQEQVLLDAGANINLTDNSGNTALIIGAYFGTTYSIHTLMAAGVNINAQNMFGATAVMAISLDGSPNLAALLTYCPDLTLTTSDGLTALQVMVQKGFTVNAALIQAKLDNMCSFGSTNYSLGAVRSENCIEMVCLTNCSWNNTGNAVPNCTTPSDHHVTRRHTRPKPHHTSAENDDSEERR